MTLRTWTDIVHGTDRVTLDFPNGVMVSIVWHKLAHCDSATVEMAAWGRGRALVDGDQNFHRCPLTGRDWLHVPGFDYCGDDVLGWMDADDVVRFIDVAAAMPTGYGVEG